MRCYVEEKGGVGADSRHGVGGEEGYGGVCCDGCGGDGYGDEGTG